MQRWSTAIQAGNAYSAILVRTSDRSDDWWRTRRLDMDMARDQETGSDPEATDAPARVIFRSSKTMSMS